MAKKVKLNKVVAIEKSVKSSSYKRFTKIHQDLQKSALLSGIARTYKPRDDDGDMLPPEQTRVQLRAQDAIKEATEQLTRLFDVVATKDWGNLEARADIEVNGVVLLEAVPVTYLLFLEKQLSDLKTFIEKLPVLDASEVWRWDENQACYATEPMETHRTKKVPRVLVKYEATEEHPAQTEVWHEDVVVGFWRTIKYSGALPAQRVGRLMERVETLQKAVKYAREEANTHATDEQKLGARVLNWIFAPEQG
ncbi:MAG: hypothetical protein AAFX99_28340 [Myxococcota bacterium]